MIRIPALAVLCLFWTALLVSARASAADPDQGLADLLHHAWKTDDEAPADIWALAQSDDGYLWLGTGSGVYRFDGIEFTLYAATDGASITANTTAMTVLQDGTLWSADYQGHAASIHNDRIRRYGSADGVPPGMTFGFARDATGRLWMANSAGLVWFDGSAWRAPAPAMGYPARRADWILADRQGTLWVATGDMLVRRPPGGVRFEATGLALGRYAVLAQAPDGAIWISDARGTRPVPGSGAGKRGQRYPVALASIRAKRLLFLHDGTLWGSDARQGGLFRAIPASDARHGPRFDRFSQADGLTSDVAVPLLEDLEGNLWAGTNLGLNRFRRRSIHTLTAGDCVGQADYDWADDGEGGLLVKDGPTLCRSRGATLVRLRGDLPRDAVLIAARPGRIWLLSRRALLLDGPGGLERLQLPDGVEGISDLLAAAADAKGDLYVSFSGAGMFRHDGTRWTLIPEASLSAPSLIAPHRGAIWIAHDATLARIEGGSSTRYGPGEALDVGRITALTLIEDEPLVAGERGIAWRASGRFHSIALSRLPVATGVTGVALLGRELWLHGGKGLIRVSMGELEAASHDPSHLVHYRHMDTHDGLPGVAIQEPVAPTLAAGDGGLMWLATNRGLASISAGGPSGVQTPPRVLIRSIGNGMQSFPASQDARLPARTTAVEFQYTVAALTAPQRIRFRYRLIGAETQWRDGGFRRQASYADLGPGHYRFEIQAAAPDGIWSGAPTTLPFVILPTFFQSRPFHVLCGAAVLLLAGLWYLAHMRQIAARVRNRLLERYGERERIARELHDTLLQGFQGLVLRFDAVALQLPQDSELRRAMEGAMIRAEEVLNEGRDRVSDLRADTDPLEDLASALYRINGELSLRSPVRLRVHSEGYEDIQPLVRDELYRICREAILNAYRHSGASTITVTLRHGKRRLDIRVHDDGIGFDQAGLRNGSRPGHWGLSGMRERARHLGAVLEITSHDGTDVHLTLPAARAYRREDLALRLLRRVRRSQKGTLRA